MRWPLAPVALFYIAGILLGQWLHPSLSLLFAASFACVLATLFWRRERQYPLSVLLILMGWTNLAWHNDILSPNDLRLLTHNEPAIVSVRGTLHATPVARIFEKQGRELWHSSVVIDVSEIHLRQTWQPAFGKIIAYTSGVLSSNFFNGQSVEVSGVLAPLSGPRAEGLFDARTSYAHQGIYRQLRTESEKDWAATGGSSQLPLSDRFSGWARKTLALGLGPEDTALRLIWTLALDWKAPLTESIEEPFMRAGTFHIFAVDGLRIGLLAAIGIGLLRVLRLPRAICGCVVIPLIWFYVGITGWPASAIRAAIMTSIVILGWAGRRPADLINSLFAAAFIILVWNPGQLFLPGFQLSFLVVFCIALLLQLIRELFQLWVFKPDPFLPDTLRPRWPAPLRATAIFLIDNCALSLAAWLGSIPLAAYYFHLFTPVSLPANIVVVPLTALALMSSIGSLLTGAWLPDVAVLFNHTTWFLMNGIIQVSNWAAHWNPGSYNVSMPSPVTFVLYYLVLFSVLTGWIIRSKFKWLCITGIFGLSVCWMAQRWDERRIAHLHFLPLDGGQAVFADNCLFDCGNAQAAESLVKPFLAAHGVNTLDAFALTVGHVQDTGGAKIIFTNFSPNHIILNPAHDRSPVYREVIDDFRRNPHSRLVNDGDNVSGWTIFTPLARPASADDHALVAQREIQGHSVLLLSTLGRTGQSQFIATHPNLRAEIVATGLPTIDEPLSGPLLELLQPKLIIIIDSEFPATRRASDALRQRLKASGIPAVYCRDHGSLKLDLARESWELKNASGETVIP